MIGRGSDHAGSISGAVSLEIVSIRDIPKTTDYSDKEKDAHMRHPLLSVKIRVYPWQNCAVNLSVFALSFVGSTKRSPFRQNVRAEMPERRCA